MTDYESEPLTDEDLDTIERAARRGVAIADRSVLRLVSEARRQRASESQSVGQPRPYFRMAGHLDDAIREGRRDDARALAVSIARLMGADIPEHTESKSKAGQITLTRREAATAARAMVMPDAMSDDEHAVWRRLHDFGADVKPMEYKDDEYHLTMEQARAVDRALVRSVEPAEDLATECKSYGDANSALDEINRLCRRALDGHTDDWDHVLNNIAGIASRTKDTECRSVDVREAIRQLDMAAAVCRESAVLCLINDALRVLGVDFGDTDCGSVDRRDGEG